VIFLHAVGGGGGAKGRGGECVGGRGIPSPPK